ncbi:Hypothetical protein CINCED_3A008433 [Cinara cedri]|uniref:SH3 domain-containing protein n=1 Tax=Cinara cedri TaxID=506608 RepID=A0A5E4MIX5_9HEMI|nr:Hypothetical protein CINCED_3A008433 [Cinara cedri]
MGLRSSSLAKKSDDTLTWVLHKKDPSAHQHESNNQKTHGAETANILVSKSYPSSTSSEHRGTRHNNNNNSSINSINNHVQRKRRGHAHSNLLDYGKPEPTYGYGITDLDDFLSKASIGRPGNIPMVLCTGCLLYQTQLDDHYQTEVALPLGMVVNAVFKNEQWLYVQTPHAEEGYIPYGSCLPLGIVPPPDAARAPCWETQSDVFPRPVGDRRQHRQRRDAAGHRGRSSASRWSSVDSGAGDDDDGDDCDGRRHRDDVSAALTPRRRRRCGPDALTARPTSAANGDDGRQQRWLWIGGHDGTSAAQSVTGYGYF